MAFIRICDLCGSASKEELYTLMLQNKAKQEKYKDSAEQLEDPSVFTFSLIRVPERPRHRELGVCTTCRDRMDKMIDNIQKGYKRIGSELEAFRLEVK
jgi:hypothetical protein